MSQNFLEQLFRSTRGIEVVCFAASYAIALALEATRLFFRSTVRKLVLIGWGLAGLAAHTLYLVHRAAEVPASPLSTTKDWYLLTAWVLAGVYLYLTYYHPRTSFGLILLPVVLILVTAGAAFADPLAYPRPAASRVWGVLHSLSIVLATVSMFIAFMAGVMYLLQSWRLKRKLPPPEMVRLPSLEWLRAANSQAITLAILMLAVGILSGMVLNLMNIRTHRQFVPWTDPLIVATLCMFAWLAGTVGIGLIYRPAREGRKVALLTILSAIFLAAALIVLLSGGTQHGGGRNPPPSSLGPSVRPVIVGHTGFGRLWSVFGGKVPGT